MVKRSGPGGASPAAPRTDFIALRSGRRLRLRSGEQGGCRGAVLGGGRRRGGAPLDARVGQELRQRDAVVAARRSVQQQHVEAGSRPAAHGIADALAEQRLRWVARQAQRAAALLAARVLAVRAAGLAVAHDAARERALVRQPRLHLLRRLKLRRARRKPPHALR